MNDRRGPSPLRVALPWLREALQDAAESGVEPALPALNWLAARARHRRQVLADWREWLLQDAGLGEHVLERFPAGPCLLAADMTVVPSETCAVAQPVHLATALDHLRLAPPRDLGIAPAEADALLATVNAYLADTGYRLAAATPQAWTLLCRERVECSTFDPADAVGRNVRDFQPSGRDGPAMRSLTNELQMLLHDHPVNEERERRGLPAINSVWLWGFGAVVAPVPAPLPPLATDDAWLTGLWRLHGAAVQPATQAAAAALQDGAGSLIALARPGRVGAEAALIAIESDVLVALRAAIAAGACSACEILAGDTVFALDARSRWRFWRRDLPVARVFA